MDYLLIFPPHWSPIEPCLGIPCLVSQLKQNGFKAEALDLNIEFFDDVLKKSYLKNSIKKINNINGSIFKKTLSCNDENETIQDDSLENQALILKEKMIKSYLRRKSDNFLNYIQNNVEKAVSDLKNPKKFYDIKTFIKSFDVINNALYMVSLPYAPNIVMFNNNKSPLLKYNFENIKFHVFSESTNIFLDYYKKWILLIKKKNPKYIGISLSSREQLIPALTLSHLLKTNTNAHISIGGPYFTRVIDEIIKYPEFFDIFADSISIDEGEKPIIELANYIEGKIPIEDVSNLVYKKNNEVTINKSCKPIDLNKLPTPDYTNYKLSKYITPNKILPIEINRGCYWNKCTFCDLSYGKHYSTKNADKLITELKEYKKKYNVSHFELVDESVSPTYFKKISEKILENKLNVKYHSCARTETGFTKEILKNLSRSGLKLIMWGIESASDRVLQFINKGIDIEKRLEILQNSSDADIWNHGFAMIGIPSETVNEAEETIKMLNEKSNVINSVALTKYSLGRHCLINKSSEKSGVAKIINDEQNILSDHLEFESTGMTKEEIEKIEKNYLDILRKKYSDSIIRYLFITNYLFLYISHYGVDWVKNYKLNDDLS